MEDVGICIWIIHVSDFWENIFICFESGMGNYQNRLQCCTASNRFSRIGSYWIDQTGSANSGDHWNYYFIKIT